MNNPGAFKPGCNHLVTHGMARTKVHRIWCGLGWPPEAAVTTPVVRDRRGQPRGTKFYAYAAEHGVEFSE